MPDVIIVGAGLAGMSAAVQLVDKGTPVHVLEANPFVGGRTSSWNDNGMDIESGLHRYLGFYTELPALLKRVGVDHNDILCWEDEIEIRTPDGAQAVLGMAPFFKPIKTARAVVGNNDFLPPGDKLALGRMFAAGTAMYLNEPEKLDKISVYTFAKRHKVSERAITRLLIPLTEGIFFMPIKKYSAYNLFGLFVPFIKSIAKLRAGAFMGGMSEVMMRPMVEYVEKHGGEVTLSSPVERLHIENGRVVGVKTKKGIQKAHQVILAASLYGAKDILRKDFADEPQFQDLFALPTMPAVTFQIELTDPSMELDRTTFGPQTALASFAEQSRTTFRASKGRLSVILTPPEQFIDMPAEDILPIVIEDAAKLGIAINDTIKDYRKVSLPHDFYSLATGNEALRPPQKTHIPGLTLAGDYTKQPHLATMEGAVVSGKSAAHLVTESLQ